MTAPILPPQQPQPDPRGVLCFVEPLPADLQNLEDSRQAADFAAWDVDWRDEHDADVDTWTTYYEREATSTEVTLLSAIGFVLPAEPIVVRVSFPSPWCRRRRFGTIPPGGKDWVEMAAP
jgi:hypothetical protein